MERRPRMGLPGLSRGCNKPPAPFP